MIAGDYLYAWAGRKSLDTNSDQLKYGQRHWFIKRAFDSAFHLLFQNRYRP